MPNPGSTAPIVAVQRVLSEVVRDVEVRIVIFVDIHETGGIAPAIVGNAPLPGDLSERPVAAVQEQQIGRAVGCAMPGVGHHGPVAVVGTDVDVRVGVAVDVGRDGAEAHGGKVDAGLLGHVPELDLTVGDPPILEQDLAPDGGEKQIGVPVVVEVDEERSRTDGSELDKRFLAGFPKRPVSRVDVKVVLVDSGRGEIDPAVPVDVRRRRPVRDESLVLSDAERGEDRRHARGMRHLREQVLRADLGLERVDPQQAQSPGFLAPPFRLDASRTLEPLEVIGFVPRDEEELDPRGRVSVVRLVELGRLDLEPRVVDQGETIEKAPQAFEVLVAAERLRLGRQGPMSFLDPLDGGPGLRRPVGKRRRGDLFGEVVPDRCETPVPHRHRERQQVVGERLGERLDLFETFPVELLLGFRTRAPDQQQRDARRESAS